MLFTQADNGSESFNLYVDQLAKQIFPEFEFKDLPLDDPIYSLQMHSSQGESHPRFRGCLMGPQVLWVHSPTDLAVNWQQRTEKSKHEAFELGVNLFVYAGGKTELRNRIRDRAIAKPDFASSEWRGTHKNMRGSGTPSRRRGRGLRDIFVGDFDCA